jgi:hypothetical protein
MRIVTICLLSLAVIASVADAQTLYRWVDKNGKVTYSDQPPPKDIKKVEQPRLKSSTIETSELPYEAQQAARNFPVTLYTAADCKEDCDTARIFLRKRGIPFVEKAMVNTDDAAAFKKLFAVDGLYLPSITVGSLKQQGFEEGTWNGLLDSAGYPRTAIPHASPAAPTAPAPVAR